jgi:hypothetical protein
MNWRQWIGTKPTKTDLANDLLRERPGAGNDNAPDEAAREAARHMTASWMDPVELGAYVVEGIATMPPTF